jgi:predicted Rossmann-fold nucleotide-binding protein
VGRRGRTVEVDTLEQFDDLVGRGAERMRGWRVQGVDLRGRSAQLRAMLPAGSLFVGVDLDEDDESWLREHGALVFHDIPDVPFDAYRSELYTPDELYRGLDAHGYAATPDSHIYGWARSRGRGRPGLLAAALHDHAIDEALDERLKGVRAVGVMGGHAVDRASGDYAGAARLGRALAQAGLHVVTGGGPGAMEAANLGAYLSAVDDGAVDDALETLGGARARSFRPSVTPWAKAAFAVRSRHPDGADSTGIPTWFYGHEPPNAFATGIAKYFQNALREDTLLRRCEAGIVFLPGAAGTVQEIFDDACENYYADTATVAPMVLVGRAYWTEHVPVWPLLAALARDRAMEGHVHLADSAVDAVAYVADNSRPPPEAAVS